MADSAKMKKVAEDFGYQLAFLKSDKELYKVFTQAVNGGWDGARFVAAVRGTKWYKTHSETFRTNTQLRYTDPKTYQSRLDEQMVAVRRMVGELGVSLTPAQIKSLSTDAFNLGWSADKIREQLAGHYSKAALTGVGISGQVENALRQTAWKNGVNVTDTFIKGWAKQVANGQATVEDAQQSLRERYAASIAPGFQKELKAGQDLYDLASPYMQTMARTLELNPADIDLFDPTIRKALASSNDKDGQVGSVPLWQFERELKKDQRWLATTSARDQLDKATRSLGQMFGVSA